MSKASYARGFCKAAEAAGVDPNELMKFAQEFKTNGWAPSGASTNNIPFYIPAPKNNSEVKFDEMVTGDAADSPASMTGAARLAAWASKNAIKDPRRKAWIDAHKRSIWNAGEIADSDLELDLKKDTNGLLWKKLAPAMRAAYHSSMQSLTGTPQRVSAPVKK